MALGRLLKEHILLKTLYASLKPFNETDGVGNISLLFISKIISGVIK